MGLGEPFPQRNPSVNTCERADKVKSLSPHHRFVIALHSPDAVVETGLSLCPAQKNARKLAGFDWTLPPVLFAGKTCGIAAMFSDSCSNVARFLCNPDCVAERVGFESVIKRIFKHILSTDCLEST